MLGNSFMCQAQRLIVWMLLQKCHRWFTEIVLHVASPRSMLHELWCLRHILIKEHQNLNWLVKLNFSEFHFSRMGVPLPWISWSDGFGKYNAFAWKKWGRIKLKCSYFLPQGIIQSASSKVYFSKQERLLSHCHCLRLSEFWDAPWICPRSFFALHAWGWMKSTTEPHLYTSCLLRYLFDWLEDSQHRWSQSAFNSLKKNISRLFFRVEKWMLHILEQMDKTKVA